MRFEFGNNLSGKTNEAIQKAREEVAEINTPEKDESAEMLAIQEEIARENNELESGNVFSRMSETLKKRLSVALTGVSAFFIIMASADTAEAGRRHRNDNYSDFLKGAVEDVIGNIPRGIERNQRRMERQEDRQQRRMERQEDRWIKNQERDSVIREREDASRRNQFESQRQEALSRYRGAIAAARSDAELRIAKEKYDLEVQAINTAERGE